jgi:hypothetical protein
MGRLAGGDLQGRPTPLANVRAWIMISTVLQFLLLCFRQFERPLSHNRLASYVSTSWIKPHPPPFSFHEGITEFVRQNSLESSKSKATTACKGDFTCMASEFGSACPGHTVTLLLLDAITLSG